MTPFITAACGRGPSAAVRCWTEGAAFVKNENVTANDGRSFQNT